MRGRRQGGVALAGGFRDVGLHDVKATGDCAAIPPRERGARPQRSTALLCPVTRCVGDGLVPNPNRHDALGRSSKLATRVQLRTTRPSEAAIAGGPVE